MAIKLYNSSIKNVYAGDNKIKSVYVGDNLIYESIEENVGSEYNIFVFDTNKVSNSKKVTLQNYRAGDTTEWDGLTDWGDGTIDSNTSHTYASDGIYTVKTKYMINNGSTGDGNTKSMLINCTGINSNITTARYMFYGCKSLTSLDLSGWNTSNVTDMEQMFSYCSKLTSLDVSNFDTSSVTNMGAMFRDCKSLTSLDLSNFDTSNVTKMITSGYNYDIGMFYNCSSLTSLNLSSFNTSNIDNMDSMFYNCSSLTSLNLSSFKVNEVMYMRYMFYNCSSLKSLDLSNWHTYSIKYGSSGYMFSGCSKLTKYNVKMTNCDYETTIPFIEGKLKNK